MTMGLQGAARSGIPLPVLARLIKRAKALYPKCLVRISSAGVWSIRHTKTRYGYESLYLDELLDDKDLKAIEKAAAAEESNLIKQAALQDILDRAEPVTEEPPDDSILSEALANLKFSGEPEENYTSLADRDPELYHLASLVAVGAKPIPTDLEQSELLLVLNEVSYQRRQRLVGFVAQAIANDIYKERQAKKQEK